MTGNITPDSSALASSEASLGYLWQLDTLRYPFQLVDFIRCPRVLLGFRDVANGIRHSKSGPSYSTADIVFKFSLHNVTATMFTPSEARRSGRRRR